MSHACTFRTKPKVNSVIDTGDMTDEAHERRTSTLALQEQLAKIKSNGQRESRGTQIYNISKKALVLEYAEAMHQQKYPNLTKASEGLTRPYTTL